MSKYNERINELLIDIDSAVSSMDSYYSMIQSLQQLRENHRLQRCELERELDTIYRVKLLEESGLMLNTPYLVDSGTYSFIKLVKVQEVYGKDGIISELKFYIKGKMLTTKHWRNDDNLYSINQLKAMMYDND
jgi:hypothetical protein